MDGSEAEKTINQGFIRLGCFVRKQAEDERNSEATNFAEDSVELFEEKWNASKRVVHQPGGCHCETLQVVIGGVDQNVVVWTR